MKKIIFIFFTVSFFGINNSFSSTTGSGEVKFSSLALDGALHYFDINAVRNNKGNATGVPSFFAVSKSGRNYAYTYCPSGQSCIVQPIQALQLCRKRSGERCYVFAKKRKIIWNQINYEISRKASRSEVQSILEKYGFYGNKTKIEEVKPKITKKKETIKKVVKKYELKGERSIALSWEGYEDLIAGTIKFDETDYKGTLELPLPNNDGSCDGTYSLQKGGKGTWQIACTNNMGAAGTLKWVKDGGVTGIGRDHNDKKVKFTVSKDS